MANFRHTSGTGSFRTKKSDEASEGRSGHGDVVQPLILLFPTRTTMCEPFRALNLSPPEPLPGKITLRIGENREKVKA
jgi:hypothetical protein